jgi:hypothetical protein
MNRFWEKVNTNGPIPEHCPELGPCWVWTASTRQGYGTMWLNGKMVDAHRISWFLKHGEWPENCVLHKCDERRCVNPDHFFSGTRTDNNRDKVEKGRSYHPQGERNGRSRIGPVLARQIRNSSSSLKSAAELYGVSITTVSQIRSGVRWGHL